MSATSSSNSREDDGKTSNNNNNYNKVGNAVAADSNNTKKQTPNNNKGVAVANNASAAVAVDSNNTRIQTNIPLRTTPPNNNKKNLLGATIRIKKGKFANFQGKIIEKQHIRRLMLDSLPGCAFDIEDVVIVLYASLAIAANAASRRNRLAPESTAELTKRYQGATVRVTLREKGGANDGALGKVARVIIGDWYITDNPNIANAFQAHKFDVLTDADGGEEDNGSGAHHDGDQPSGSGNNIHAMNNEGSDTTTPTMDSTPT